MRRFPCGLSWLIAFSAGACAAPEERVEARPPAVAGAFYPAEAGALRALVRQFLAQAPDFGALEPVALISPHAGLVYSGKCAACGYATLRGKTFERVIVLGLSHRGPFRGAALPAYSIFRTPLGDVPIDTQAVASLRGNPVFSHQPAYDRLEHSIEVQIPFLQEVLPAFKLVPIMIGFIDGDGCRKIAEALLPLAGSTTLVVASSDFTHLGERFDFNPFNRDLADRVRELDFGAIRFIVKGDRAAFADYVKRTGATICGSSPIGTLVELQRLRNPSGEAPARLLSYTNSAEVTGATSDAAMLDQGSVSYASIAFLKAGTWKGNGTVEALDLLPRDKLLDDRARGALLGLARATVRRYLSGERHDDLSAYVDFGQMPPEAKFRAGAFVTLKSHGDLRGCIGSIYPQQPLWEAVVGNAIHAAVHDHRFSPVKADELGGIDIEISVLTPPQGIEKPDEFRVGTHGIILEKLGRRAVFLPQVAPEQGWTREETLDHLARKAGLPTDAWREGTRFWVFEAQVFGEKEK